MMKRDKKVLEILVEFQKQSIEVDKRTDRKRFRNPLKVLETLNDIYKVKVDEEKLAKILYRKIYSIFGYRIVPLGEDIKNIDERYVDLAHAISKRRIK